MIGLADPPGRDQRPHRLPPAGLAGSGFARAVGTCPLVAWLATDGIHPVQTGRVGIVADDSPRDDLTSLRSTDGSIDAPPSGPAVLARPAIVVARRPL